MSSSARAIVLSRPGDPVIARVGLPDLGPRDVLVRTLFSGVSTGTDKWVMQGRFTWIPVEFPLVPGYQRFGVVEAMGGEVSGLSVGQQVVATSSQQFTDACAAWGGHVSLAVSDRDEVFDATGIVPERASLIVSGQVGFNAASRILAGPGRVVVYGDGIIGLSGALSAKARGYDVLLVGRHAERLEPARRLGLTTVLNGVESSEAVRDWRPVAVIDTIQNDSAFLEYVDALPAVTGQIVFSGHSPGGVKAWADMERLQQRELTTSFVSGWTPDRIESTLELMRSGALPLERFAAAPSRSEREVMATIDDVVSGTLAPVAAVLDWRDLH
jgi:2-desacetyl-2-hydroxyethyl bacteriochlorophyllide A dehydrogenase